MDAGDLRINNIVNKGIISGITYKDGIFGVLIVGNKFSSKIEFYPIDEIEPIELTEEWLLKGGFEKQLNLEESFHKMSDNGILLVIKYRYINNYNSIGYFPVNLGYSLKFPLKGIHHLQNLYIDLTGEELNFRI